MGTQDPLEILDGRRFAAADVRAAARIDQATLTNIINKTDLELCSEPPGRGRARQFCLIDVYQIALHSRMVRITHDAVWAARALNHLLFIEPELKQLGAELDGGPRVSSDATHAAAKDQFCATVRGACEVYSHRQLASGFYIWTDVWSIERQSPVLRWNRRDEIGFLGYPGGDGMVVWSITELLWHADRILIERLKERGADV